MTETGTPADPGRRVVGWSALIGGVMCLVSIGCFAAVFGTDPDALVPDLTLVSLPQARLFRWAALTDMLGFYLAPIPVAVYLRHRIQPSDDPVASVGTAAGLAYSVIGAIGAVTLAAAVPQLLADGGEVSVALLGVIRDVVYVGLWQTLETIPLAVWMLTTASQLSRGWLKVVAMVIGISSAVGAVGRLLELEPVVLGLGGLLLLFPVWLLGIGWKLARREPL